MTPHPPDVGPMILISQFIEAAICGGLWSIRNQRLKMPCSISAINARDAMPKRRKSGHGEKSPPIPTERRSLNAVRRDDQNFRRSAWRHAPVDAEIEHRAFFQLIRIDQSPPQIPPR